MTQRTHHRQVFWLIAAGALALLISASLFISHVNAKPPSQETEKFRLSCHGDESLSMTLPSAETLSLYIAQDELSHSVHSSSQMLSFVRFVMDCSCIHPPIRDFRLFRSVFRKDGVAVLQNQEPIIRNLNRLIFNRLVAPSVQSHADEPPIRSGMPVNRRQLIRADFLPIFQRARTTQSTCREDQRS